MQHQGFSVLCPNHFPVQSLKQAVAIILFTKLKQPRAYLQRMEIFLSLGPYSLNILRLNIGHNLPILEKILKIMGMSVLNVGLLHFYS